ncbi:hypothetical protein B6D12_01805 [Gilliamella apicola]|uniref:hypothetical protein n=1 Tax=Gilliamella TaxID=1193503 RepID=UPI00081055C8|nr:hypothetical protein [Gilliamella apicola]OCF91644.1 hypothetical protein A9G17_00170 [Gilliamella apicola]OTP89427.1 hypothetical protein B5S41_06765 [Gilliamella apicola]OTP93915.1 hypothetical protein B6D13_08695 [Gilliamella apicola]OTP94523.1 hypothetical protein B6D05_07710 [Gilliamella apicola]OTQ01377.1 hypothetical protein B6D07_08860 [Gilliamella apicola]
MLKCSWFMGDHNLDSSLNPQKCFQSISNLASGLSKIMLDKSFYCKISLISASIFVGLSINDVTALNVRTANVIQANPTYLINTEEVETQSGSTLSDEGVNAENDDELDADDELEDESELDNDQMIEITPISGKNHLINSIH